MRMSMSRLWCCGGLKVHSNLESFLHSATPTIPTKRLSQKSGEADEYLVLGDVWQCYDEWSAYGMGTPLLLHHNQTVVQYYAPYLSAIQLYTNRDHKRECSSTDELILNDENNASFSSNKDYSNNASFSSNKDYSGGKSTCSSFDINDRDLGYPYFHYSETISPYLRLPLVDKIAEFADNFPGLVSLKTADLSPASWMSVAWCPIYHIPFKGKLEDLSTYFLTFHTLSSCFQGLSSDRNEISLRPFGLSTLRMQGQIWINQVAGDYEKLINLHRAAESWLKQLQFHHPDFDYYLRKNQELPTVYQL